jgi:hypothetical protein
MVSRRRMDEIYGDFLRGWLKRHLMNSTRSAFVVWHQTNIEDQSHWRHTISASPTLHTKPSFAAVGIMIIKA